MTRCRSVLILGLITLTAGAFLAAQGREGREGRSQQHPGQNPFLNDKAAIRTGMALYRTRCGECHGLDASGYRGPDLNAFMAGANDEALFQVIRKGVPGSEMPQSNAPDNDILQMIAYLRNMGGVVPAETAPVGNVANGEAIFAKQCVSCHQVAGKGGRLGPDLSRIGTGRTRAALTREIRNPHEWVPPAYEAVTIVTKDGRKIRGIKKGEDAYSIQVIDVSQRIQGYLKSNVQVIYDKNSIMPAYDAKRLNESDLTDLVGYLTTLRGYELPVNR
jgi:putative heme-binding domain-containing protein